MELGFGTAVVFSLYKLVDENDTKQFCAYLAYYRKIYRIIGISILVVGLILMPFLDKLIKEHITDVIRGKEPKAVEFEDKGDETIKVAVTGDLPPMDYVSADGSFAGFNTAILAEIGKRLNKKIELKQIDSAARAISLSSNEADVVFWTRVGTGKPDKETLEKIEKKQKQHLSEEDDEKRKTIEEALRELGSPMQRDKIDMPEGTMVTDPYYVDRFVRVTLKK